MRTSSRPRRAERSTEPAGPPCILAAMDPPPAPPRSARRTALLVVVAVAVGVAFADSSIVVLALPEIYARFDTSIEGVAWVITSYNLVVAVVALALVLVVHRVLATVLLAVG